MKYTFTINKKTFTLTSWQMMRVFDIKTAFTLVEKHILKIKEDTKG